VVRIIGVIQVNSFTMVMSGIESGACDISIVGERGV